MPVAFSKSASVLFLPSSRYSGQLEMTNRFSLADRSFETQSSAACLRCGVPHPLSTRAPATAAPPRPRSSVRRSSSFMPSLISPVTAHTGKIGGQRQGIPAQTSRLTHESVKSFRSHVAIRSGRLSPMSDRRTAQNRAQSLDDKAKRIIELLQGDGRMSYSAIAKDVGLSEAAVRHRVQKLIEGGVVQIVAVTDPMQMGFARQAMIGIKVTGDVQEVAAKLGDMDELDYIVITTGRFDILAELVATS